MSTREFSIAVFCRVDQGRGTEPKHPQAKLYPSDGVTLALLFARKGGRTRACDRWIVPDYRCVFPRLPQRTRLFRLFATQRAWVSPIVTALSWCTRCAQAAARRSVGATPDRPNVGSWAARWPTSSTTTA